MSFSDPTKNIEELKLGRGMRVADIGSGSGLYTLAAARAVGAEGRVYSIDVQKQLLDRVKAEAVKNGLTNVEVVWGDIERIGGTRLRDGSLDALIIANVIFQLSDKDMFIKEMSRILRKGGKALVIDWAGSSALGPRPEDVFDADKAKSLFTGFTAEKEFDAGDHHYGIIFKKQ